jgi:hypothetical protein
VPNVPKKFADRPINMALSKQGKSYELFMNELI